MNGLSDFCICKVRDLADSFGGFEVDHFALVTQPFVQKLQHWFPHALIVLEELGG
jgi:hypothetical protein